MKQFPTMNSLYKQYRTPHYNICFEGREYQFLHITRSKGLNEVCQHIYRNEEEQHTLYIHMCQGKPVYVNPIYSIRV